MIELSENEKQEILKSIAKGYSLIEACAFNDIDPYEFAVARRNDKTLDADIRAFQAFRVDCMVDGLLNIHKKHPDPKMAAVISKNIQWSASKRLREIYGDKVDHNVNVKVDIRAAMVEASERVLQITQANLLEDIDMMTDNISVIDVPITLAPVEIEDDEDVDPLS